MKQKQALSKKATEQRLRWHMDWVDGEPLWDAGSDNRQLNYKYTTHKRASHRDNKLVYNTRGCNGDATHRVRIPSLKRNDYTWKHFYRLFPWHYLAMRGIRSSLVSDDLRLLKKMRLPQFEAELRAHPVFSQYFEN